MAKVLVVFYAGDPSLATFAGEFVEGAKSVRFTEVRSVAVPADGPRGRESWIEELRDYDGVAFGVAGGDAAGLTRAVEAVYPRRALENLVGAVFSSNGGAEPMLQLARLGMLLVPEPSGPEGASERAQLHGRRTAQVAGWVRHALSHEHAQHHEHDH